MSSLLLKNTTLVSGYSSREGDLLINDGKIARIDSVIDVPADREIDCTGKWVLPGMIDTHVHFREPGLTHKGGIESETAAAVAGGVTTVFDMPNTIPQTTTLEAVRAKQALYASKSLCNYGIYIGAAHDNLEELKRADEDGTIPAIKIFMAESTGEMTLSEDKLLDPIFSQTTKLIAVHAEDEARRLARIALFESGQLPEAAGLAADDPYLHAIIRDNQTAALGTKRAVELAEKHNHRTHILHMSAAEELDYLRQGIESGLVTGETCPHYLWFDRESLRSDGPWRLMNPALKGRADQEALWRAVQAGVISQITTDHAPHLCEEKDQPYPKCPAGLPGVQFVLPLLLHAVHEGKLTLEQVVRLTSENPARNYRIEGKGRLEEGYDADLVIVDPAKSLTISNQDVRSKCGWTPYEGMTLEGGVVESTIVGGSIAFENNCLVADHLGQCISCHGVSQ